MTHSIRTVLTQAVRSREVLIAFIFLALAIMLTLPVWQSPKWYPDSITYVKWYEIRPPSYCVFVTMFGQGEWLVQIQGVLSILAWAFAGWMIARLAGVALMLLLATAQPVSQWNLMLISESFSFSMVAMSIGMTLVLLRRWSWISFAVWVCVVAVMSFTRLSNLFIVPFLVLPFLFRSWRFWLPMGAVAASLYLGGMMMSSTRGATFERMEMSNVILYRILPDPEARAFFHEHGMPLDDRVMEYSGKRQYRHYRELWARVPEFKDWLTPEGMHVYKKWLLRDTTSFRQAWSALNEWKAGKGHCLWYGSALNHRLAAEGLIPFYVLLGEIPSRLWLCLLILPLIELGIKRSCSPLSLMLIALMLITYTQAFICFHGDTDEVPRHMVIVGILFRVTLLTGLILLVQLLFKWKSRWWSGSPLHNGTPRLTR